MDQSAVTTRTGKLSLRFSEILGNFVKLPGKNLVTFRLVINQMSQNSNLYSSDPRDLESKPYICFGDE